MRSGRAEIKLSRRQVEAVSAVGSAAFAIDCHARNHGVWKSLKDEQTRVLAAVCHQIAPADEFPSASQAGFLTYIDQQLVRHYRRHRNAWEQRLGHA